MAETRRPPIGVGLLRAFPPRESTHGARRTCSPTRRPGSGKLGLRSRRANPLLRGSFVRVPGRPTSDGILSGRAQPPEDRDVDHSGAPGFRPGKFCRGYRPRPWVGVPHHDRGATPTDSSESQGIDPEVEGLLSVYLSGVRSVGVWM